MASAPAFVFYSYSHKDDAYRAELATHLALLRRRGLIEEWFDRNIDGGTEWERKINDALQRSDVILLLVSADFIASDYCFGKEMQVALERHKANSSRVIPIIIRSVDDWQQAPFGHLQALPPHGRPVASWDNRDEAWTTVARGIRVVVESVRPAPRAAPAFSARSPEPAAQSSADTDDIERGIQRFSSTLDQALQTRGLVKEPAAIRSIGADLASIRRMPTVLWVDDQPANNRTEANALFALQIAVDFSLNTKDALLKLHDPDNSYDLVITDWSRPPAIRLGASEGLKLLQRMKDEGIDVPAICYHGEFDPEGAAARDKAVRELGAIGATPDPSVLLSWCAAVLSRGAR